MKTKTNSLKKEIEFEEKQENQNRIWKCKLFQMIWEPEKAHLDCLKRKLVEHKESEIESWQAFCVSCVSKNPTRKSSYFNIADHQESQSRVRHHLWKQLSSWLLFLQS